MTSLDADTETRGPGRPPNLEHRAAVLDAARSILAEQGYEALTFQAVAARAGLYRRYVNRSWGSKAELVRDALFAEVVEYELADTGTFRTDLEHFVRHYVRLNLRPDMLRALPSLQVELIDDPALLAETLRRYVEPPLDALATLLGRGVSTGAVASPPAPALVLASIAGSIQQIALQGLLDEDAMVAYVVRLLTEGVLGR